MLGKVKPEIVAVLTLIIFISQTNQPHQPTKGQPFMIKKSIAMAKGHTFWGVKLKYLGIGILSLLIPAVLITHLITSAPSSAPKEMSTPSAKHVWSSTASGRTMYESVVADQRERAKAKKDTVAVNLPSPASAKKSSANTASSSPSANSPRNGGASGNNFKPNNSSTTGSDVYVSAGPLGPFGPSSGYSGGNGPGSFGPGFGGGYGGSPTSPPDTTTPSPSNGGTNADAGQKLLSTAMSGDGHYRTVVDGSNTYVSSDDGTTWKTVGLPSTVVTMSYYGQYQMSLAVGRVYSSSDYGQTWQEEQIIPAGYTQTMAKNWSSIAVSDDGQCRMAAGHGGYVNVSSNGGVTWKETGAQDDWTSVAMSYSGEKQIATSSLGYLSVSTDGGATFYYQGSVAAWTSAKMSGDGQYLVATASPSTGAFSSVGGIFTSSDGGTTWVPEIFDNLRHDWTSVAMSGDGRVITAAQKNGQLYTSSNFGKPGSWLPVATSQPWTDNTMSADGTKQEATVNGGFLWVSTNSGATWSPKIVGTSTVAPIVKPPAPAGK